MMDFFAPAGGQVCIKLDNPLYRDGGRIYSRDQFSEMALGFVVADVKVRDELALRLAMERAEGGEGAHG